MSATTHKKGSVWSEEAALALERAIARNRARNYKEGESRTEADQLFDDRNNELTRSGRFQLPHLGEFEIWNRPNGYDARSLRNVRANNDYNFGLGRSSYLSNYRPNIEFNIDSCGLSLSITINAGIVSFPPLETHIRKTTCPPLRRTEDEDTRYSRIPAPPPGSNELHPRLKDFDTEEVDNIIFTFDYVYEYEIRKASVRNTAEYGVTYTHSGFTYNGAKHCPYIPYTLPPGNWTTSISHNGLYYQPWAYPAFYPSYLLPQYGGVHQGTRLYLIMDEQDRSVKWTHHVFWKDKVFILGRLGFWYDNYSAYGVIDTFIYDKKKLDLPPWFPETVDFVVFERGIAAILFQWDYDELLNKAYRNSPPEYIRRQQKSLLPIIFSKLQEFLASDEYIWGMIPPLVGDKKLIKSGLKTVDPYNPWGRSYVCNFIEQFPYNEPPPPPPRRRRCECMANCCPQNQTDLGEIKRLLQIIIKRIGEPVDTHLWDVDPTNKGIQVGRIRPQSLFKAVSVATQRAEMVSRIVGIHALPSTVPASLVLDYNWENLEGLINDTNKGLQGGAASIRGS